jgi:hypothetical protein
MVNSIYDVYTKFERFYIHNSQAKKEKAQVSR